jgi:hypothetical protein
LGPILLSSFEVGPTTARMVKDDDRFGCYIVGSPQLLSPQIPLRANPIHNPTSTPMMVSTVTYFLVFDALDVILA